MLWPKTAKSVHILDVFSGQGDQIELIPFALSQARLVGIDVNDLSGRLVFIRSKDPRQY